MWFSLKPDFLKSSGESKTFKENCVGVLGTLCAIYSSLLEKINRSQVGFCRFSQTMIKKKHPNTNNRPVRKQPQDMEVFNLTTSI